LGDIQFKSFAFNNKDVSDAELKVAGIALYNLSKEISKVGFAKAVEEKGGVSGSLIYMIPLDKQPYCAVIRRNNKIHRIELGKYNLRVEFGSVIYLPLEWDEGNLMRKELLEAANSFIDYLSRNKGRLLEVRLPNMNETENDKVTESIDNSLLGIIDGHNLSEVLAARIFKGQEKRRLINMIDRLQDDGIVTVENGKYKVKSKT
jgi:hypothetical protein